MDEQLRELIMCYIEQFGYDIVIGKINGIDLSTILELRRLRNG